MFALLSSAVKNLLFTIRPIQFALQQDYDRQMQKLTEDAARRKYADFIENMGLNAQQKHHSHAVAPVSAVCAAFAAQPGAYPPEAQKPDVAPTCGRTGNSTKAQCSGFGRKRKCGNRGKHRNGQNRGILDAASRKQEKRLGAFLRQPVHFCPQCGQFWAVKTALFCEGEKWISADFRKKPRSCRCCRHYFGAFHFWRG